MEARGGDEGQTYKEATAVPAPAAENALDESPGGTTDTAVLLRRGVARLDAGHSELTLLGRANARVR